MAKQEKNAIPKWLKKLQESSWELELLISGGAIFSLFQLGDFFIDWVQNLRMISHFTGGAIILMVGMIGIKTLTLGFILHLLFRAFWLALVCINYVFPGGIQPKKIKASKPFKIKLGEALNLREQIIKVDNLCGITMYLTLIAALSILGFTVCLFFLIVIMLLGEGHFFLRWGIIFGNGYLLFLFLYFVDYISFGLLRRIPIFTYIIYLPFQFFDLLSLRKWYRRSLWLMSSNINKFKYFFLILLFVSTSVFLAYNSLYHIMHWPNISDDRDYRWQLSSDASYLSDLHYMDNWGEKSRNPVAAIESKRISGNYMEVFVRYDKVADFFIDELPMADSAKTLASILSIVVDDQVLENVEWINSKKQNGLIGVSSFIDISSFKNGRHEIFFKTIPEVMNENNKEISLPDPFLRIPFWIDRPIYPVLAKDS